MPKAETSNSNGGRSLPSARPESNWLAALLFLLAGLLLTAALVSYEPTQSRLYSVGGVNAWENGKWTIRNVAAPETNWVGIGGAEAVHFLLWAVGIGTWLLLPAFCFWSAWLSFRHWRRLTGTRLVVMPLSVLALAGLAAMFESFGTSGYYPYGPGGAIGQAYYRHILKPVVGDVGTALLLGTAYLLALVFVFDKDITTEMEKLLSQFAAWRAERTKQKALQQEQRDLALLAGRKSDPAKAARAPLELMAVDPANKNVFVAKPGEAKAAPAKPAEPKADLFKRPEAKPDAKNGAADKAGAGKISLNIVKPEETKKAKSTVVPSGDDNYKFPPLALLKEQVRQSVQSSEEEHRRNAENLLRILGEFGVEVTLGEIHVGPVITRYEVVPAAGVRVEKISGLDKNIALGMRAQSVRILAPIPGKAAVGVEVPNEKATPVGLREIIESELWSSSRAELPIALGKDVSGKPLISDLSKMPHLLIAGATGSGKSVCINSIVASILYSKSPHDVRMIMVDPKVVELKMFNALPHMLIPVLTEPKKVPAALKWLLREMEQRYQIFGKVNVRNIIGFNSRKKGPKADTSPLPDAQGALAGLDPLAVDDGIEVPEHLPYIVVIVDELADLMMVAPAEIETNVARLAQLARAAGIHLIIATQRPSVNVVTGIIKANLPSRIAFQVASQIDSRTIIDTKGAETLIGRGDMLFTPPASSSILRAQGAFVADDEMQSIVDYLKENNDPPIYAQAVQQQIDRTAREEEEGEDGEEEDEELGEDSELYQQAIDVLKSTKRASTSMLQRRLRIGYNRAARIMEVMEDKGIVGPENGSSPREILVDLDSL
jgi:DNA segregation ATPase FtsK/SpoIIIE, S-DNA-T family